ncbi:hypothetical protein LC087_13290 [Bacillus carboniphilus]|uniref:Tripartite tricarboxylate transporter TctB family protein n=1 Tax=Bacillus carboniphilus TaxID=86663 RepID=A0ABY9JQX8_9BACI|nr:hypothetical protein [Bacillus carboniphilus]WLR41811.1 hypothetical protein LC087_13290 [Bacillus carboniphilus]
MKNLNAHALSIGYLCLIGLLSTYILIYDQIPNLTPIIVISPMLGILNEVKRNLNIFKYPLIVIYSLMLIIPLAYMTRIEFLLNSLPPGYGVPIYIIVTLVFSPLLGLISALRDPTWTRWVGLIIQGGIIVLYIVDLLIGEGVSFLKALLN